MKKLLTTVLVLTMIATVFCVSPVVYAAAAPTMAVVPMSAPDPSDDTIRATFLNVADAKWVVYSIMDKSTGEYIFMEQKRGSNAQTEGFLFEFKEDAGALNATVKYHSDGFLAEATITAADGTVLEPLTQEFKMLEYSAAQTIFRQMLAGTKTISEAKAQANFSLPTYYVEAFNDDIVAALNVTFASQLGYPSFDNSTPETIAATNIPQVDLETALKTETITQAIKSNNITVVTELVNNFPEDVGIDTCDEYAGNDDYSAWGANQKKSEILTKLTTFDCPTTTDFVNQFKTEVFLAKLAENSDLNEIIGFLKTYNNTYYNYGETTNLTSGTLLDLNFDNAGGLTELVGSSDTKAAYAADYMAKGTYNSLTDLEERFTQLLANLPSVNEPVENTPENIPDPGVPVGGIVGGGSVSVGLVNPIVGENSVPFTDLDDVEWANEAIRALYLEGVIDGVSAKQFQPNANVTREQFIKIIVNTFGLKGSGTATTLADVNQNEWYAPFINTAVELGIINGVSATEFGIGQNITRQDMAVIMYRVANYIGKDITAKSSRVPTDMDTADDYADEAIVALYQSGIVNGVADGIFAGWQTATRAQAAKLCYDLREAK